MGIPYPPPPRGADWCERKFTVPLGNCNFSKAHIALSLFFPIKIGSMEFDKRTSNRHQWIKLVNWYRFVSANRWSIDSQTKAVHWLLSIGKTSRTQSSQHKAYYHVVRVRNTVLTRNMAVTPISVVMSTKEVGLFKRESLSFLSKERKIKGKITPLVSCRFRQHPPLS